MQAVHWRCSQLIPNHVYYWLGHRKNTVGCYLGMIVNTVCTASPSAGEWSSPPTTGPRPPPCSGFSFTAINHHMAVMFGGSQAGQLVNDVYIIDFRSMVRWEWSCNNVVYIHVQYTTLAIGAHHNGQWNNTAELSKWSGHCVDCHNMIAMCYHGTSTCSHRAVNIVIHEVEIWWCDQWVWTHLCCECDQNQHSWLEQPVWAMTT